MPGFCTDTTAGAGGEQAVSDMFGFATNTDPVLVFDPFGNLFYSHIAFNANKKATTPPSTSGALLVSTYRVSDAGAATYAKTESVPSGSGLSPDKVNVGPGQSNFDDKQWMTVDTSPASPFHGRVYITWTKFRAQAARARSTSRTAAATERARRSATALPGTAGSSSTDRWRAAWFQESFPATAPDGTLYVAFLQFQGGFGSTRPHAGVWLVKSTDGGRDVHATARRRDPADPKPDPAWRHRRQRRAQLVPHGHDPDGGRHLRRRGASRLGRVERHRCRRLLRALDRRGASFAPDERVTDVSSDPNAVSRFPVFCPAFIGDYLDIDAVDGRVAAIWNDNRNVTAPLSPADCRDFIGRSTDALLQSRLDSGALDQEAFTDVIEQP